MLSASSKSPAVSFERINALYGPTGEGRERWVSTSTPTSPSNPAVTTRYASNPRISSNNTSYQQRSQWLSAFHDLFHHIHRSEPTTRTYFFGIPIEDALARHKSHINSILTFESYSKPEDLYDTHLQSPEMKAAVIAPDVSYISLGPIDINPFEDVSGFLDRNLDAPPLPPCSTERWIDIRIWCRDLKARKSILRALKFVANEAERNEPACGSFLVLQGVEEVCLVRVFSRWRDERAWQVFRGNQIFQGFFASEREGMRRVEVRGYVPVEGMGFFLRR